MKYISKLLVAAAVAAIVGSTGAAFAEVPVPGGACPEGFPQGSTDLQNSGWSWQLSAVTTVSDPSDPYAAGKSGNMFVDITTTTSVNCVAVTPGGQVNTEQGTVLVEAGTSTTEKVKVEQQCDGAEHNSCPL
jgi:hypothetical protein